MRNQTSKLQEKLESAMQPLGGCFPEASSLHSKVADLAGVLKAELSAYTGTFEAIDPKMDDVFDPELHDLDSFDPAMEGLDASGQLIQWTTMIGIKFRLPGMPWRVCSRAIVQVGNVSYTRRAVSEVADSDIDELGHDHHQSTQGQQGACPPNHEPMTSSNITHRPTWRPLLPGPPKAP